jgi:hypothetical protein
MDSNHHPDSGAERRARIAWIVFAAIAAFYLWTEHRAHLLGVLPFLIVLACPVMHLFMHHDHGHGAHSHGTGREKPRASDDNGDAP